MSGKENPETTHRRLEFLRVLYHEMKNPLTAILSAIEIVCDGDAGPVTHDQQELLGVAAQQAERVHRLLEDLLDLERHEIAALRVFPAPCSVEPVIRSLAVSARARASMKGLTFHCSMDGEPVALAEEDRLQQIVQNLLDNAIKFTERGNLSISAAMKGDWVVIEVRDTGLGIEESERERIFQKFARGSAASIQKVRGTGLGLAITRALIHAQGGRLELESQPGEGSLFRVVLPAADAPPSSSDQRS